MCVCVCVCLFVCLCRIRRDSCNKDQSSQRLRLGIGDYDSSEEEDSDGEGGDTTAVAPPPCPAPNSAVAQGLPAGKVFVVGFNHLSDMDPHRLCLLLFYILATSAIILGWVPTCDSAHSGRLCSAVPLGNQATSTMN